MQVHGIQDSSHCTTNGCRTYIALYPTIEGTRLLTQMSKSTVVFLNLFRFFSAGNKMLECLKVYNLYNPFTSDIPSEYLIKVPDVVISI